MIRHVTSAAFDRRVGLGAMLLGSILTASVLAIEWQNQQQETRIAAIAAAKKMVHSLDARLSDYQTVARGVKGLLESSEHVTLDEFRHYVATLHFNQAQGLQGIGFVQRIEQADKLGHIELMRQKVHPDYRIHPDSSAEFYAPIVLMEPLEQQNLHALGLDIWHVPSAREAALSAQNTGAMHISSPLVLVQDQDQLTSSQAFVMYLPVYRYMTKAVDQPLVGWVNLPVRMNDLIAGLSGQFDQALAFSIRDIEFADDSGWLYQTPVSATGQTDVIYDQSLAIGGRIWQLEFSVTPAFAERYLDRAVIAGISIAGALISGLLSLILGYLFSSRASNREYARLLFEQSADAIFIFDNAFQVIKANPAALSLLGYGSDELKGMMIADLLAEHEQDRLKQERPRLLRGENIMGEWWHRHKRDTSVLVEVNAGKLDQDSNFAILRDLTERRVYLHRIERLNNLYRALSEVNLAIVRMEEESELLPLVCRCAVDYGGMTLAWIAILEGEALVPATVYGQGQDYVSSLNVTIGTDQPSGRGPTATAFRENRVIVVDDYLKDTLTRPWHEQAARHGWQSAAVFPIMRNEQVYAVLNVYHTQTKAFDQQALALLKEMAVDIGFALDNFDRVYRESEAERQLALHAKVFDVSHEGILICNQDNHILSSNPAFSAITGYSAEQVYLRNPSILASGQHEPDFYQAMWQSIQDTGYWQGEVINRRKNGELYPQWLSISVVKDMSGRITHYVGILSDLTEHKATQEQIQFLIHFDSLTSLPNRELLYDRAKVALANAQRYGRACALIYLDLDRFKLVNDSLGPGAGDQLIKQFALRLAAQLRPEDTLCRQGGDEFILLLPNTQADEAAHVAAKIQQANAQPFTIDGHSLTLTVSMGIAEYPNDGKNFEELAGAADAALFRAKEQGRDNFQFFTKQLHDQARQILQVENDLRIALEKNQLQLYYQPQVDARSFRLIGCEALLRWQHPEKGLVSPGVFIPIAEESGLIVEIGSWVMQEALRQLTQWQRQHRNVVPVAVNLSAMQFRQATLVPQLKALLRTYPVNPELLELEMTESVAMGNSEVLLELIETIKAMGIKVSIDDFGTGYSSLSYLKRFKIDKLKIDQSFIRDLERDRDDEAIVDAILGIAQGLGFRTIAEGVETQQQLHMLQVKGCDEIQGYYFGRPMPATAFEAVLAKPTLAPQASDT
ncbi:MAG: EAL domain-containing protein [Methylococcales bacterium]|nr:EAL domain-containing protein [Methylococcales bacterium]